MKIVIDISQLHPLAFKRGVGIYSLNLFRALKGLDDGNEYVLKKNQGSLTGTDLIHYPFFDPFFLTLPYCFRVPFVTTIHDLIPLKFADNYPVGLRGKLKWQIQKRLVKKSLAIITDSISSKKDIKAIIGFPKEKIFPIYLAVEKEFKKIKDQKILLKVRQKYGLEDEFGLYVGDLNWNKNVFGLAKAISGIKGLNLVLAGSAFKNNKLQPLNDFKKLTQELGIVERIKILGFIDNKDLAAIYNLATFYIQPSFDEGFGLPVLEAMTCGCPVLTSNQGSLPEIGARAVAYFNPAKANDLENNLSSLLKNKNKLKDLEKRGLCQAKKFSWRKTALETRKVYEKIINHH